MAIKYFSIILLIAFMQHSIGDAVLTDPKPGQELEARSLEDILENYQDPLTLENVRGILEKVKDKKFLDYRDNIQLAISSLYLLADPSEPCEITKLRKAVQNRPTSSKNFTRLVKFVVEARLPECVRNATRDLTTISLTLSPSAFMPIDKFLRLLVMSGDPTLFRSSDRLHLDRMVHSKIFNDLMAKYEGLIESNQSNQRVVPKASSSGQTTVPSPLYQACRKLIPSISNLVAVTDQLIELSTLDPNEVKMIGETFMLFLRTRLCNAILSNMEWPQIVTHQSINSWQEV